MIAAILTLRMESYDVSGEILSSYICYFSLAMTLVFLPVSLIFITLQKGEKLKDKDFMERWGQLYSNMDVEKR